MELHFETLAKGWAIQPALHESQRESNRHLRASSWKGRWHGQVRKCNSTSQSGCASTLSTIYKKVPIDFVSHVQWHETIVHSNACHILAETLQIWRRATTLPEVRIAVLATCAPVTSHAEDGWQRLELQKIKWLGGWAIWSKSTRLDCHTNGHSESFDDWESRFQRSVMCMKRHLIVCIHIYIYTYVLMFPVYIYIY